jgi:hypothetical protein
MNEEKIRQLLWEFQGDITSMTPHGSMTEAVEDYVGKFSALTEPAEGEILGDEEIRTIISDPANMRPFEVVPGQFIDRFYRVICEKQAAHMKAMGYVKKGEDKFFTSRKGLAKDLEIAKKHIESEARKKVGAWFNKHSPSEYVMRDVVITLLKGEMPESEKSGE